MCSPKSDPALIEFLKYMWNDNDDDCNDHNDCDDIDDLDELDFLIVCVLVSLIKLRIISKFKQLFLHPYYIAQHVWLCHKNLGHK